jgi:hypothetical protein
MRTTPTREARNQKGLEAARKRLWPGGDAPPQGAPRAPEPAPDPACEDDAPTLPFVALVAPLRAHVAAPRAWIAAPAALICAWLLAFVGAPGASEDARADQAGPALENLTVRGAIRIVDDLGNIVALIGSVPGTDGRSDTTALELRSAGAGGARDTVRLESLASGASLSLKTPDRHSSLTLVSGEAGPYVLMAQGAKQRLMGTEGTDPLPAVASGPASTAGLDLRDRRAQSLGDGLFAVDLRVSGNRLRGRILNTSSVRHTGIEVDLSVADQALAIRVPLVSPGNSTGFAVALPPGLPEAHLREAQVARVSSTLRYDATQPGSESAQTR